MGYPSNGKEIEVNQINIERIVNGKIAEALARYRGTSDDEATGSEFLSDLGVSQVRRKNVSKVCELCPDTYRGDR
jgi:hypothetical protein